MNTKVMVMAENVENPEVKSFDGTKLEVVDNLNYLGARTWIASSSGPQITHNMNYLELGHGQHYTA